MRKLLLFRACIRFLDGIATGTLVAVDVTGLSVESLMDTLSVCQDIPLVVPLSATFVEWLLSSLDIV